MITNDQIPMTKQANLANRGVGLFDLDTKGKARLNKNIRSYSSIGNWFISRLADKDYRGKNSSFRIWSFGLVC